MQSFSSVPQRLWRWLALFFIALVPRLVLLRVYDIELSQDGFDAVNTLSIWRTQGIGAVPRDLMDRFILHPLYMLLLAALRFLTPASIDFYFAARLLSALIACVAVILLFEFTRRAYGEIAAWVAALFLAFAPSFLWESVAILSSTLFLALYIGVLFALLRSRYRLAAFLAFLAALTRYEGVVLVALIFAALCIRDLRARARTPSDSAARGRGTGRGDWLVSSAFAFAFPLTLAAAGALATGNALEFLGAQSMAAVWLRFLAPGDFARRGAFFITQYPALFPALIVWLGGAGAIAAVFLSFRAKRSWHRSPGQVEISWSTGEISRSLRFLEMTRATALLLATSALYLVFDEALVWLNYTTLEVRFLMYPGLPLLVFAGWAIEIAATRAHSLLSQAGSANVGWLRAVVGAVSNRRLPNLALAFVVAALCIVSYQQGDAGIRFIYNSMASMRQMADELAQIVPRNQTTNLLAYTGTSGALDLFARQRGMYFTFTDFRFAPDDNAEQFLIDRKIQFVVYPVGNAFAKAKYPYLARFETQTHGAVTFQPLTQFATSTDNQLYSIWAVTY